MTITRGGRLPETLDGAMQKLNSSVHVDCALWREDIAGSKAHARIAYVRFKRILVASFLLP